MRPGFTKFLIKSRIPDTQLIILAIVYLISGLALLEFDTLFIRIGKLVPFDYRILIVSILTVIEFDIFQLFARNVFVKSDLDFMANYGARQEWHLSAMLRLISPWRLPSTLWGISQRDRDKLCLWALYYGRNASMQRP